MASLRDKLNMGGQRAPAPKREKSADCYRVTAVSDMAPPAMLPGEVLEKMAGETLPDVSPDGLLFLDTETTGLSGGAGTLAFLTGMGYFEHGRFVVEQVLMRDYDEECFALSAVADRLKKAELLVTFNGRTFDMPLLESRFTLQRMRADYVLPPHLDLLRVARATWRLRLKRCSLSALEEEIFHRPRGDDLPGALVPKSYFEFLKTRDFALLEPILRHNAQDIRTLPLLLGELLRLYQNPLASTHPEDVYSIGRVMEKRGGFSLAHRCYRAADQGTLSRLSRLTLADSYRRQKRYREAAGVYERMISAGQGGAPVLIRAAKLLEHHLCDPHRALYLTRRAILLTDPTDERAMADAQKRALRLARKCERDV